MILQHIKTKQTYFITSLQEYLNYVVVKTVEGQEVVIENVEWKDYKIND